MANQDFVDKLVQLGVGEPIAKNLKTRIDGNDLMGLINALDLNTGGLDRKAASDILGKYGIKLGSNGMSENYLTAKFESLRDGSPLDETFGVMTRLSEGFSYAVEVTEQTRDRVLDWLDENQVEYQANSPVSYRIECVDRDVAYRTGRALSEILRKPTVRDSVEIEEKMSKNTTKRVSNAKAKMADMTPRNPMVAAVKTRGGAGAHDKIDPRKDDTMGRKAKHKPRFDEEIENLDLNEGVMGMKPVNALFRLRELAGLPLTGEDDFEGIEVAEVSASDPEGPLGAGTVDLGGDDIAPEIEVDGMGADPVADPMPDMDGGMGEPADDLGDIEVGDELAGDLGGDIEAGVPGDLPPVPVEPIDGMAPVPTQSDAMSQIEDALNSIQSGLADIRLSEYKSLIQKLQDLTNQAQMMGRDYLGERRKK